MQPAGRFLQQPDEPLDRFVNNVIYAASRSSAR